MLRPISIVLTFLFASACLQAQDIRFTASAPGVVEVGERFNLTLTLNSGKGTAFRAPEIKDFRILMGPSTQSSSSVQIINGEVTRSTTYNIIYVLEATREGKFVIPEASIEVDGKTYTTEPVEIEVVGGGQNQSTSSRSRPSEQEPTGDTGPEQGDLFLRLIPDRTTVYLGEAIQMTVKIYTRVSLTGLGQNEPPSYDGFFTQDIETPSQISLQRENLNGKIYNTGIIDKVLLFPQQTGEINIEPYRLETFYRQRREPSGSLFDDFFSSGYRSVSKMLTSNPVSIRVKALPKPEPVSYTGAVGSFTMNVSTDKTSVSENDAITLSVNVSGNGNLHLVQAPGIKFPPDFESYDPRVNTSIKNTDAGSRGSIRFEYLMIPRHAGNYRIPPVEFSYFDPRSEKYKTPRSSEILFEISPSEERGDQGSVIITGKEGLRYLADDILFIKTRPLDLRLKGHLLFGQMGFYLYYVLVFLLFGFIIFLRRQHIRRMSDPEGVKNKKAARVARKRLAKASKALREGEASGFYNAILQALWGYLADKLNIQRSEISRELAEEKLVQRKVKEQLMEDYFKIIDRSQFAQYAPAGGKEDLKQTYHDATACISELEKAIR